MNIEIVGLKKAFGNQLVLDIKSMEFGKGLTCILGPNGCGKSTLLNILSGQLSFDTGSVMYNGKAYEKKLASEITLVHQKPFLFNRNVYDNIAYPLKVRKYTRSHIEERVNELLDRLQIENLKAKIGTRLSGGESQKVAIARALVFEPELLMLDEPTSNIDEGSSGLIEKLIKAYSDHKTVIMVTHDYEQAKRMSDSIIKL